MNNLIVIHGALGSARQLDELCQAYEEYYDVFSFDLSGHGGLPINERFSIDLFTKDLQHFIVVNELEGADVFGYSMGGYVALNHARLHPGKLGRIITLGTKFHWNPAEAEKEIRRLNADLIEQKLPKFANALEERHAPEDWKKHLEFTAQLMHDMGNGSALDINEFSSIKNPVLVTIGGKDKMVTIEESKAVADILPNGDFLIFEDFEHPIEQINLDKLISETI
jgi:pimeloyl-ACP methyl ester carboxylesterase